MLGIGRVGIHGGIINRNGDIEKGLRCKYIVSGKL